MSLVPFVRYVCVGVNATTSLRCEPNQPTRPPWTAGLGSLPNEPWYGSLEMWKRTHLGPIQFYKAYASLDVTGTRSAAHIMGIIVWLAVTPRLAGIWTDTHIKRMLENKHKNADAFNTFSTRIREKEFDRSTTAPDLFVQWLNAS